MNEDVCATGRANLSACVVCFRPDAKALLDTIKSLERSARVAVVAGVLESVLLFLVNNGPDGAVGELLSEVTQRWQSDESHILRIFLRGDGANLGFGVANNLCLDLQGVDYHLVLNPDVELAEDALVRAVSFMTTHSNCGLLTPRASNEDGTRQYLCKRYPSLWDLFLRGFAPGWLKRQFTRRLIRYEMGDTTGSDVYWNPPIVSGCFMLFRMPVFQMLGGFDSRFFLYFEDFDLSLRARALCEVAYVPDVRIVHAGGGAARKGLRHVLMFCASAFRFFSKHGWKVA